LCEKSALRRAENNYEKADEVIEDAHAKNLLPPTIYRIMSHVKESVPELLPVPKTPS
jgi:hypothetical protein